MEILIYTLSLFETYSNCSDIKNFLFQNFKHPLISPLKGAISCYISTRLLEYKAAEVLQNYHLITPFQPFSD